MMEGKAAGYTHRMIAFLDEEDDPKEIPNSIHSTEGARPFGFTSALVAGATSYRYNPTASPPSLSCPNTCTQAGDAQVSSINSGKSG